MKKNKTTPASEKPAQTAVKTLNIPRYTLSLLYTLLNIPLHGPQLRARNVFAKTVRTELEVMEDNRIKMLEALADKDKKTKEPLKKEDGSEYVISEKNMAKYRKDFDAYMHEAWVIDLLPSIKPALIQVRPLILESKTPLGTVDGYAYEDLATAFEAM